MGHNMTNLLIISPMGRESYTVEICKWITPLETYIIIIIRCRFAQVRAGDLLVKAQRFGLLFISPEHS